MSIVELLFVFASVPLIAATKTEISWQQKDVVVSEGDDVEMTCNFPFLDILNIVSLVKCKQGSYGSNGGDEDCVEEIVISENKELKEAFEKTSRYTLIFTSKEVTLKIKNAEADDAGRIKCQTLSSKDYSIVSIAVKSTKTEAISWQREVVMVSEGDEVEVTCNTQALSLFDIVRLAKCKRGGGESDGVNGGDGKKEEKEDCEEESVISENIDLKESFRSTSRYTLNFTPSNVTLKITNAKADDTGRIKCHILGVGGHSIVSITVKSRAKSILFFSVNDDEAVKYYNGSSLTGAYGRNREEDEEDWKMGKDENIPSASLSLKRTTSFGCVVEVYEGNDVVAKSLLIDGQLVSDLASSVKKEEEASNVFELLLSSKTLSTQFHNKEMECRVKMGEFEEQSSRVVINITTPCVVVRDSQGFTFRLYNYTQPFHDILDNTTDHTNDNTTVDATEHHETVSFKLVFHVFGNPSPKVNLHANGSLYTRPHGILLEYKSPQLLKVTIAYIGKVDTEMEQSIVVDNGEGVETIKFRLGDREVVRVGDSSNEEEFEIFEKNLKESFELDSLLKSVRESSGVRCTKANPIIFVFFALFMWHFVK